MQTFNYHIKKWEKDILSDPPLIILWKHYSQVVLEFQSQPHLGNLNINSINLCLRMKLQKVKEEIALLVDKKKKFPQPIQLNILEKENLNLKQEQTTLLKLLNSVPTHDIKTNHVAKLDKIRKELGKVAAISMNLSQKQLSQKQQEEQKDQPHLLGRYQKSQSEVEVMKSQISQNKSTEIRKLNSNTIKPTQKLHQTIQKSSQFKQQQEVHQAAVADISYTFQESKQRIDSQILNTSQIATIQGYFEQIGKPSFSASLLYRATRDGFGAINFHRKCDNKGPTLTIIKTLSDHIIGGYTNEQWDGSRECKPSYDGWLFTIAHPHPFKRKKEIEQGIWCYPVQGPFFGELGDIAIMDYSNIYNDSWVHGGGNSYEYGGVHLLKGKGPIHFKTKEIEVYEILYQ
ncbi:hypothetical protein FGO68_gene13400 [Halteria grandinella]|uniref:TLDc domain-containing protein n=1 Tax=Halteria grandinella TaxID=5974 RepID=A0A8J8NTR3_HALGN|nr:hypothetical protein FGO68_gene13400 [Halteria grandinella]